MPPVLRSKEPLIYYFLAAKGRKKAPKIALLHNGTGLSQGLLKRIQKFKIVVC